MAEPLRVFLSHTAELRNYPQGGSFVQAAERAVARAGHAVVDMAYFTARDKKPAEYCRQKVRGSDVYVGLVGFRFGSRVRDDPDRSYVQLEYEAAGLYNLPRLMFLLSELPALKLPVPAVTDRRDLAGASGGQARVGEGPVPIPARDRQRRLGLRHRRDRLLVEQQRPVPNAQFRTVTSSASPHPG